jgi:hypothetical protein
LWRKTCRRLSNQVIADDLPANEMLLNNSLQHIRATQSVPDVVGIDDCDRSGDAHIKAGGLNPQDAASF